MYLSYTDIPTHSWVILRRRLSKLLRYLEEKKVQYEDDMPADRNSVPVFINYATKTCDSNEVEVAVTIAHSQLISLFETTTSSLVMALLSCISNIYVVC
jgi:hypothetical protein